MCPVRVFISHAHHDRPLALGLARTLEASEPDVEIETSDALQRESVGDAMSAADVIVLLIGSEAGEATRNEWSEALTTSFRQPQTALLPIVLRGVEVPGFLRDRPCMTVDDDEGSEGLRAALAATAFRWDGSSADHDALDQRLARVEELAAQLPAV